jgi:hypothetical protein
MRCCECGKAPKDWGEYVAYFERRGKLYCEWCAWNTAEKRAYEKWHVERNE